MSGEKKIHAVFDGIEEEDNVLPGWWLAILFVTTIFGFGYWFAYHTTGVAKSTRDEYLAEAAAAKKKAAEANPVSDEALLALAKQEAALAAGKQVFSTICLACHGPTGGGTVGPNLTDNAWIHGGKPERIFKSVMEGFPEKGMPPWGKTLGVEKTRNVVAFVLTLKNTNVAGGKPPQGEAEQ